MGGTSSTTQRQKREIRHVAKKDQTSCDLFNHVVEERCNERNIDDDPRDGLGDKRDARHEDERDARREEELISDSEDSSSCTTEEEEEEEKKFYDPADTTLTFVEGDDDLDFECYDYKSLRAQMSCGHAVTPTSLTTWCRYQLDEGNSTFVCGVCDVEWPFEEVCKMALLTPEEIDDFDKKVFQNTAMDLGFKFCPGCKSHVMRKDRHNLSVICPVCTAKRGRPYTFCWQCLKKWKGPSPRSDHCKNVDCQNPLDILKSCPEITFEDVEGVTGCPSIRACPTCGLMLEHDRTECKNIFCTRCKLEFCFVCLKLTKDCADETNVITFFNLCAGGVAPRQTSMPVWQRTSVDTAL
ncbi:E3 ubiquitin-protein ligase RNF19B-like [Clinocottus analis]|uniref:E3 ubiquitin-protein ligase RNF19B-like n=1 Tax=Clinocottus analis TaxID=304258 RepID=UPI0035C0E84F